MKVALNIKTDAEFGRIAGASKSVVNQWKSGLIQTIAANYAYSIQDKTGFSARWIMTGEGPQYHFQFAWNPSANHAKGAASDTAAAASGAVGNITAMMAYIDKNLICRFANDAYLGWFGKTPQQVVGRSKKALLGTLYEQSKAQIERALSGHIQVFERTISSPGGKQRHSIVSYVPDIVKGSAHGIYVYTADVSTLSKSERKRLAERLLINYGREPVPLSARRSKSLLESCVSDAIQRAESNDSTFAVITVKTEHLNNAAPGSDYKNTAGVIKDTLQKVQCIVRSVDVATPINDRMFVLLLNDVKSQEVVQLVLNRVLRVVRKSTRSKTDKINSAPSAGIALYPQCGTTPDELLANSERALSTAKKLGKRHFAFAE